jgi:hypothetical protein
MNIPSILNLRFCFYTHPDLPRCQYPNRSHFYLYYYSLVDTPCSHIGPRVREYTFDTFCWPLTKLWDILGHVDIFWTSTTCRRRSARRSRYREISAPFWVLFGMCEYVMEMGCQPMGLPMFRPIL